VVASAGFEACPSVYQRAKWPWVLCKNSAIVPTYTFQCTQPYLWKTPSMAGAMVVSRMRTTLKD